MSPDDKLNQIFRLTEKQKIALAKLKLETVKNLLFYLPSRYENQGFKRKIEQLKIGETVVIFGQLVKPKTTKAWRQKIPIAEATIVDDTGKIKAAWFHQAFLAKKFPAGSFVRLAGKIADRQGQIYLANPNIALAEKYPADGLFENTTEKFWWLPIYPETKYLSSLWFFHHMKRILANGVHKKIPDSLPPEIITRYRLPSLATALVWIHTPKTKDNAEAAKKRFAFEEIFKIQLERQLIRRNYKSQKSFLINTSQQDINRLRQRFDFNLTTSQQKASQEILNDLASAKPMIRLLEGDVGSGKTAVAAIAAQAIVNSGYEVAYMAPTEVLAKQHFKSFIEYFGQEGIQIGLLTSKECRKFPSKISSEKHTHISRRQLLKWVANGEIPIVIGTHALIQKTVKFKNLALVIIDEQHRFGVMQRAKTLKKEVDQVPHLLSMTATPIPRTLALTIYGDLDLSLLDKMPIGRKPIITEVIKPKDRNRVYEVMNQELSAGRQAFVVCPRIEEPDPDKEMALNVKSAKAEKDRLAKDIFPQYKIGLLHSKMLPKAKETEMQKFIDGQTNILVATSVIEVGINVPEATVMVVEGAERFGLSQLHQLRGRVWRSHHQAFCFLLSDSSGAKSLARLQAVTKAKNGFALAEMDLKLRGPGTLSASKQWGISDLGMSAIKNIKLVEAARYEAGQIIEHDPSLDGYPLIKKEIEQTKNQDRHWE